MMRHLPVAVGLAAAILLLPAAPARANLLVNGSFESGSFTNQGNDTMSLPVASTALTGWTVVTDTMAWIGPNNPFGLTASEGDYFIDLTNYQAGSPFAGMRQTIATLPGATYALSFDLGSSSVYGRPAAITASAAGATATFTSPATGGNDDWMSVSMSFVATAASTTVTLQGSTGLNYIGLDNASVDLVSAPVPEPAEWALMIAGLAGIAGYTRRSHSVRGSLRP